MGFLDLLLAYVSNFRTPKFMDVQDLRLGTSNLVLQILICIYFIIIMVSVKEYETKYIPDGTAQYFMSSEDMYKEQASPETQTYCTAAANQAYDYTDPDCKKGDKFWCEDNIKCAYPTFGEASKKFDSSIWAYTYLKDGHYFKGPCQTTAGSSATAYPDQASCNAISGVTGLTHSKQDVNGDSSSPAGCLCSKTVNTFLTGTEGARIQIASSYYISDLDKREINVVTRVRKAGFANIHGPHESDEKVFTTVGKNINLTVKELLVIAGITNLNAPNEEAMGQYPSDIPGQITPYRQTGYEIQLDFAWLGSVGSTIPGGSNVELILSVIGKAGYSSKGNDVSYIEYPTIAGNLYGENSEYHDRYYRGIKFGFTYGGVVGYFDTYNLIVVFTSFTILLSVSGTIVSLVAYYLLGYESEVYTNYGISKVSIKRLHGKVAAQALIASAVWKQVIKLHAHEAPSFEELIAKYEENGYGHEDAMFLAKALLETGLPDEDKGLTALKEKWAQAGAIADAAGNVTGANYMLDAAANAAGIGESKKQQSDEEFGIGTKDDPFKDIRDEHMSMVAFCDLVSEEQTSLAKCMDALGGGEIELADDSSVKMDGINPNIEMVSAFDTKIKFTVGEYCEAYSTLTKLWKKGVITGKYGSENFMFRKDGDKPGTTATVVHKKNLRKL